MSIKKSNVINIKETYAKLEKANRKKFKPIPFFTVSLANGQKFEIEQTNSKGHFKIIDQTGCENYATTIENAFKNVLYQAKISDNYKHLETLGRSLNSPDNNFCNGLAVKSSN